MLDNYVSLSNVRVAGEPTFFPHADPKKHKCLLTVIKNRGKNPVTGVEMKDEIGLVFWGKYAQSAALYLDKGRAINIQGTLRSHTKDTGQVKPNGKADLHRNISVNVSRFEFGPESKKELVKRVTQNIEKARAAGLIPMDCTLTAEYLIDITRPAAYDYNPQTAQMTGRYGNAKVYIKGSGFITAGEAAPAIPASDDQIAKMEAEIVRLKAAKEAAVPAAVVPVAAEAGAVDPFPTK